MRASIVIPAHNEGDLLWKTVRSCIATTAALDCEILVADDASADGSIEELRRRYPSVRLARHRKRQGCPATKDLGARKSRGDVMVFIDGHTKPERGAIARLVADVECYDGEAVVTPRVPVLHTKNWKNSQTIAGSCFRLDLKDFECGWIGLDGMWMRGKFYESPGLVGCCLATSRKLYKRLCGFDRHMIQWGCEDIDFGLKAWLMGYPILHDSRAVIGHRFRVAFDTFKVAWESILVNKLRMARKNFTDPVWKEWLQRRRSREPKDIWSAAWKLFLKGRESLERERAYLVSHRVHDEYWFARRFELKWPVHPSVQPTARAPRKPTKQAPGGRLRH